MLKTILGIDPIREKDLTPSAMMRVRASSIAAMLIIPFITTLKMLNVFGPMSVGAKLAITGVSILVMAPFIFSRVNSIFIRSKKNLDEWELRARTNAQSFSYRVVGLILVLMFLAIIVFSKYDLDAVSFKGASVFYVLSNLFWFVLILPATYVVWTQKPLSKGEELEDRSDWVV